MKISRSKYYIIFLLASIIIISLPIGNTGQQIRDFGILNNSKGVIQIESLDQNFAAINYQINDNSTISADHFTGG